MKNALYFEYSVHWSGSNFLGSLAWDLKKKVLFPINLKFKTKTIFRIFIIQNLSHFHTGWVIFEGLATKVNLNQIEKYFKLGLLGPKKVTFNPP
jgi:hypothetical protein